MIADLSNGQPDLDATFDVCIVGAGAAGIAVALRLADAGRRVLLLEAGGLSVDAAASQAFCAGENSGPENVPLGEARISALGGSTNHWGGWCRPLDPHDFRRDDFGSDESWPIGVDDIRPYAEEASRYLGVNKTAGDDRELQGSSGSLTTLRMDFSEPPRRLGKRFRAQIKKSAAILLLVNAAVTEAEVDVSAGRVTAVRIAGPALGEPLRAAARFFVLAMGSVANAQRLLLWNRAHGDRLGGPDWVGRCYFQHLHQRLGDFVAIEAAGRPPAFPPGSRRSFLGGSTAFLKRTGIGAFRLYSTALDCDPLRDELRRVAGAAVCASVASAGMLLITCEQAPNRQSRIMLGSQANAFGELVPRLEWQVTPADGATMREAGLEFGRYLVKTGLGRFRISAAVLEGDPLRDWLSLPSAPGAAGHQMGGARMSALPGDGVVDRNCLVWGSGNLFVAGSAVFRTCGHANPTLSVVQLSLRLADRLLSLLR